MYNYNFAHCSFISSEHITPGKGIDLSDFFSFPPQDLVNHYIINGLSKKNK